MNTSLKQPLEEKDLKTKKASEYTSLRRAEGQALNEIQQAFGLSEYQLHAYVKVLQQRYRNHIDSNTAQKIATTVWKAVATNLYGKGKHLHFKKYGQLNSVEGKSNKSGIRYKEGWLTWNGLLLKAVIRDSDLFAQEALATHSIKYCRLLRKTMRGKTQFFVQLILEGTPPPKRLKDGSFKHKQSPNERVGLDIGPSSLAVVSPHQCLLVELAQGLESYDQAKRRLLRKLDRSRRATNPDNYNEDGTIKRGVKLKWTRSKTYLKTLFKFKDIERKRCVYRKQSHDRLANQILVLGNDVYIETMRWKSLQTRKKETEVSEKTGKMKRKKRFGKSIGNHAPSAFVTTLKQKLAYQGLELKEVNTTTFKASQLNHVTGEYQKKELKERWAVVENQRYQRDLYSAFLLMNAKANLQETNIKSCEKTFEAFKRAHEQCLVRLKKENPKRLSSFGF